MGGIKLSCWGSSHKSGRRVVNFFCVSSNGRINIDFIFLFGTLIIELVYCIFKRRFRVEQSVRCAIVHVLCFAVGRLHIKSIIELNFSVSINLHVSELSNVSKINKQAEFTLITLIDCDRLIKWNLGEKSARLLCDERHWFVIDTTAARAIHRYERSKGKTEWKRRVESLFERKTFWFLFKSEELWNGHFTTAWVKKS